jgi:hypothetical protein
VIREGLHQFLSTSPTVTAIVGTPATRQDRLTGIFPVLMPEATPLPAVVFHVIAGEEILALDGASGLRRYRIQFNSWACCAEPAAQLAESLWKLFSGMHSTLPDGTEIDDAICGPMQDGFDVGALIYRSFFDTEFWFREP